MVGNYLTKKQRKVLLTVSEESTIYYTTLREWIWKVYEKSYNVAIKIYRAKFLSFKKNKRNKFWKGRRIFM